MHTTKLSAIQPIHHHQCILPPHLLREIVENGTDLQKRQAINTMQTTSQLRELRREVLAEDGVIAQPRAIVKSRRVYDARRGSSLPGMLARSEGDPPVADPAVNEAYDGSGATYDLFWEIYQRNSIDNAGLRLDSTVHYQVGYDNAFWDGRQMVYGDGDEDLPEDQRLFNRFTSAVDVIGHELCHGVVQYEANLAYVNQSGALNESWCDVFGSLVLQRLLGQTASEADWLIGSALLTARVNGQGIRSLKAPGTAYDDAVLGKDPQPAHMRDYQNVSYDSGGVHINSGIPNHAFYLTAMRLGGAAWEKAGQIWYVTLRDKLGANSTFQEAAQLTYQAAGELYGPGSLEQQAVQSAWSGVGLNVDGQAEPPQPPDPGENTSPGCLPALTGLTRLWRELTRR